MTEPASTAAIDTTTTTTTAPAPVKQITKKRRQCGKYDFISRRDVDRICNHHLNIPKFGFTKRGLQVFSMYIDLIKSHILSDVRHLSADPTRKLSVRSIKTLPVLFCNGNLDEARTYASQVKSM
jgi:hypothetical protein